MTDASAYRSNGPRPIPVGGAVIRETNTSPYPVVGVRIEDMVGQLPGTIVVRWSGSRTLFEDPDTLVYMPEWDTTPYPVNTPEENPRK